MNIIVTPYNRQCTKCMELQSLDQFSMYCGQCKKCQFKSKKQYRETHKEQIRENSRKWLENNVELRRENKRRWDRKHRLDPTHRLSNNIRTNMCHALRGKKGFRKWESLVGYTLQDLINHLQSKLTPDMTWDNYGSLWQVDHITPKSWFKYDVAEHPEFKKCWSLENLQPKLAIDNIKKGNRFIG